MHTTNSWNEECDDERRDSDLQVAEGLGDSVRGGEPKERSAVIEGAVALRLGLG
jgi:hypothetical protein